MKYGIQAAPITNGIHVGRINKAGNAFLDGKEDCTDMAICAVAEYARKHFKGGMKVEFPGMGFDVEVKVTERKGGDA